MSMREIKFRGRNVRHGWLTGHYVVNRGVHFIVEDGIADPLTTWEDYAIAPETVGQYTGLKDRNGKDVWEGDLLRTPEGDIMVAEWIDAKIITRCVRPYNPRYKNSLTFAYPVSVVVGNIYDNPELLEEGK